MWYFNFYRNFGKFYYTSISHQIRCLSKLFLDLVPYFPYFLFQLQLPAELQEYADGLHDMCIKKTGITEGEFLSLNHVLRFSQPVLNTQNKLKKK